MATCTKLPDGILTIFSKLPRSVNPFAGFTLQAMGNRTTHRRTGMGSERHANTITEPAKERPVLYDVDVAVAGAGLCGTFAAIASGRCGARTLVIDRFPSVGGNIGPGMIVNGGLDREVDGTVPGGFSGMSKEFIERVRALRSGPADRYPEDASICSFVALEMMRETDVHVLLSSAASDPIMEGNLVKGLFVECPSGRVAVRARVTIDGTGEASMAARAGAPMIRYLAPNDSDVDYIRQPYLNNNCPTYYNDTQLLCIVGGVDLRQFEEYGKRETELVEADEAWGRETRVIESYPAAMIPALHLADAVGEFVAWRELTPGVRLSTGRNFVDCGGSVVLLHITCSGAIDPTDAKLMSLLETEMRSQAFKAVAFYRKYAGGFENAYPLTCSTFLGMRGGPHIEGEHTLTPEESFAGRKCDDVLYRNIHEHLHGGVESGFDVPYAITIPKGIDGLLVCGRGAAYLRRGHDPTGMRARPSMMVFGECVGIAAAVAALDGTTPRKVDIRRVQRKLVETGVCLGEPERLRELGLA
ncbi:MAG: hypothetical protein COS85_15955 [Armatimonadetes bacterium CG07_land_8_20_14_0_80_59_28]|nr:MAG: hypothetical protein COS85_15955 [Armatimonadetes bacterium CG07_land_8_20_14_0_80_59_28]PIX39833.1 MAG: hypothetical protein COZ56_16400 [Armatimonadetes bacterium CG_4_8_14_3_um_filter_58_9]PJB62163.1 MAG: hypothetical protein CO095_19150 [Armatimonadetes bacterium CG_4_9_14_3_um_filter_58_7]